MPSFLTPAFLAGLLAVAIPILVHLRMRERKTSQPFPSLMFVRRIPHKSFRRRTLQNLMLFAARALAVILLCLAFARPFFPVRAEDAVALAGPSGRVIALDVSASMGYEGVFERAVAEAERSITGAKGSVFSSFPMRSRASRRRRRIMGRRSPLSAAPVPVFARRASPPPFGSPVTGWAS
jgi:hypothetical protein